MRATLFILIASSHCPRKVKVVGIQKYWKYLITLSVLLLLAFSSGCEGQSSTISENLDREPTSLAENQIDSTVQLSTETSVNDEIPSSTGRTREPIEIITQASQIDGMEMVYVPSAEFLIGSEKGVGDPDEEPVHLVKLSGFWIDRTEVTNEMYTKCVSDSVCSKPKFAYSYTHEHYFNNPQYAHFPVIYVNRFQAIKYCAWAGRRLPSEAEWELAARGIHQYVYPWGNDLPNKEHANFYYHEADVQAVGSYPLGASPYGALDMAGNVSEWVYDVYTPYQIMTEKSPQARLEGTYHILRGGSYLMSEYLIRSAERYWVSAYYTEEDTGFRCALSQ